MQAEAWQLGITVGGWVGSQFNVLILFIYHYYFVLERRMEETVSVTFHSSALV